MKSYTPEEIIAILNGNGFELHRVNGSHHIFVNRTTGKRAVIPMHTKDLKKGTLHSILKQAGIDLKD